MHKGGTAGRDSARRRFKASPSLRPRCSPQEGLQFNTGSPGACRPDAAVQGPEFEFPTQPFRPPAHEYAVPPAAAPGPAEFDAQPGPSQDPAGHVAPSGPRVPAYQQGPSHAREVDNLAEPQVLQEEMVLVRTTSCESRTLMHVPDIVWSARHWFHSLACVRGAACPLQSTCHERYLMEGTGDPWLYMSAWPKGGKGASDTSFYGSRLHDRLS